LKLTGTKLRNYFIRAIQNPIKNTLNTFLIGV